MQGHALARFPYPSVPPSLPPSSQDKLPSIRSVFDSFLAEFPLCFGYWKKYADHELRHGSKERAKAVYERAVAAVPYSVDIWVHFTTFLTANSQDSEEVRRCGSGISVHPIRVFNDSGCLCPVLEAN